MIVLSQFHYLSPQNEQEERDYLALKVMQELEDEIIDLNVGPLVMRNIH